MRAREASSSVYPAPEFSQTFLHTPLSANTTQAEPSSYCSVADKVDEEFPPRNRQETCL